LLHPNPSLSLEHLPQASCAVRETINNAEIEACLLLRLRLAFLKETKMRKDSKLLRIAIESLLMLGFVISGNIPSSARDKNETIDATAFGTGTQLGANIGVTLNIYEFSTPADRQIPVQAYEKGQNQGLANALQE
jgi:hypothetical protein